MQSNKTVTFSAYRFLVIATTKHNQQKQEKGKRKVKEKETKKFLRSEIKTINLTTDCPGLYCDFI